MDTSGKTGPRRVAQAGQGLVEYALILCLVAVVAVVGTLFLGKQVSTVLSHTGSVLGDRSTGTVVDPAAAACSLSTTSYHHWFNGSCHDHQPQSDQINNQADCTTYFPNNYWWTSGSNSTAGACEDHQQGTSAGLSQYECNRHHFYYYDGTCNDSPQSASTCVPTSSNGYCTADGQPYTSGSNPPNCLTGMTAVWNSGHNRWECLTGAVSGGLDPGSINTPPASAGSDYHFPHVDGVDNACSTVNSSYRWVYHSYSPHWRCETPPLD
jgi:Flp pilus assembly pilin Flp